ncbi:MAG: hypothetical protein SWY16_06440 [Cyanobacteriota bacterium]|nr:hypothetical protein [Cyanobacteriota bacterium]
MARPKILQADRNYTFGSYFEMPYGTDEILAEFGYHFSISRLSLPRTTRALDRLPYLQQQIEDIFPLVRLSNETARRETLVSPVLLEVIRYSQCQLRIEYPVTVSNWLTGNLDYLLKSDRELLIIKAKNDDLTRGFTQLSVELIALSLCEERDILYGAVTMGDTWRFGKLDRPNQSIVQDITLYNIPDNLEELTRILVGILELPLEAKSETVPKENDDS